MATQDERQTRADAAQDAAGVGQGAPEELASGAIRLESVPKPASGKRAFTVREQALALVTAVAVVFGVVAGALCIMAQVPDDAAAKVNGSYVYESDVAEWVEQYRTSYSLEDDADFADSLISSSITVSDFRIDAINELAMVVLIQQRASELGATASDEEAQELLEDAKEYYADGDEDTWAEVLENSGYTEEELLEQYKISILQDAVYEADVPQVEATEDELVTYMKAYLADSTQKHAYRILFTGDDAAERAEACLAELEALEEDGGLDLEAFGELAVEYSDDEDVAETLGEYAWSGSDMDDSAKEAIEELEVGMFSDAVSVDDETVEVLYCDEEYAFPTYSDLVEVPDDVPDELMEEVEEAAADYVWQDDCEEYLVQMLAQAEITYYPLPSDASYNIDLSAYEDEEDDE